MMSKSRRLVRGLPPVKLVIPCLVLTFLLITVGMCFSPNTFYGQSGTSGTQSWVDQENNVRILFSYTPATPIIDAPTYLKFSVQNLQTYKPLPDLLARIVIVTNSSGQERIFKFTNIAAPNGVFAIKYLFPDAGLYQVITKITSHSNNVGLLASFKVFVPLFSFSLNNINGSSNLWIIIVIAVPLGIATFLIVRRII
jgi:hypothetical protein